MLMRHSLLICLLLAAPAHAAEWSAQLQPMFETHCIDCHDAETKKGDLDLTALSWKPDDAANFQLWVKLHDKVQRGEMPPKNKKRPEAALLASFLKTVHEPLQQHSGAKAAREGRVVARRLNRTEYEHTLHDLLGIDKPLRDLLPEDGTAEGFDNVGDALNLSSTHLERYLEAAEAALQAATARGAQPKTTKVRTDYEETWKDWRAGFQRIVWTRAEDGTLAIRSMGGGVPHGGLVAWNPPVPGERYRFTFRVKAIIDRDSLYSRGGYKKSPERHVIVKVGTTTKYHSGLVDPLGYFETSPSEYREFSVEARMPFGRTIFIMPFRAVPELPGEVAMNQSYATAVQWVDIEGPLHETWPPRGHTLLYGDVPLTKGTEADARHLLSSFLPKAFRRTITSAELEEHLSLFREELTKGRAFDEALRAAYKFALCSPHFLFLQEQPGELNDRALAARLSYGLWSSTPDAELLRLAAENKLHEPAELRRQTERLLNDPKGRRFTQQFLASWLNLRDIDFTQPDTKLYPEFEGYLQACMMQETHAFFDELLKKDLSVRNIVHSDFAMLNERLAEHYGIPGVKGEHIRQVALPAHSRRGGFITQGAVLKVSANGTTTSPVVRGAYILDRILGTPPDPPPKNVSAIEPDIRGATTIREQLDKHRNQSACAGCHAQLDPPGFALESFDVTGRWRDTYRAVPESAKDKLVSYPGTDQRLYIAGPKVDPSYALADGRRFKDIDEFKQLLLAHPEQLAHCLAEKLTIHLTGGRIQFADREPLEHIVTQARTKDFGVRTLLMEVILSRLFLRK